MNKAITVLFDLGGTLINDSLLFKYYANKSGNLNAEFMGPSSWDAIRNIGHENFFSMNQEKMFDIGETYCDTVNVVKQFYATEGCDSKYENFIVYDCKPEFNIPADRLQLLVAKAMSDKGIKTNGIYLCPDKVALAKTIGADYVVDDDPRIALALASANIKTILVSRLWNRSFSFNNLNMYIADKKNSTILKNIVIAEDLSDAERIIKQKKETIKNV